MSSELISKRHEYSFCPECQTWIPVSEMNYDVECLNSVCNYCLGVTKRTPECLYCDSHNVTKNPDGRYVCADCGEIFIL